MLLLILYVVKRKRIRMDFTIQVVFLCALNFAFEFPYFKFGIKGQT